MMCSRVRPLVVGAGADRGQQLGAEHDLAAPAADGPTQQLLGLAVGVDVGGVDEVHAGVQCRADDPVHLGLAERPHLVVHRVALAAEGHGAQRDLRHPHAGAAELAVFHGTAPSEWRRLEHYTVSGHCVVFGRPGVH
jgi:hypothetical protein